MSSLSSFFEKRHKKTHTETNNQLASIFSQKQKAPIQISIPVTPKEIKPQENLNQAVIKNPQQEKLSRRQKKLRRRQQRAKQLQQVGKNDVPQNLDATIFVGNVPLECSHSGLKKHFEGFGEVQKIWFRSIPVQNSKLPKKASHILKKYQQGADTKNAYIRFTDEQSAKKACQANGSQFLERNIRVSLCQDKQIDYESTIFIGNLPHKIKDQELWDAFANIGHIVNVRVIRKKQTFQGLGIAYVRFENPEIMRKAINQMNGSMINGRPMRIKKAVTKQRIEKKLKNVLKNKVKKGRTPPSNNRLYEIKGKKMKNANKIKANAKSQGQNSQHTIRKTKPINKNNNKVGPSKIKNIAQTKKMLQ